MRSWSLRLQFAALSSALTALALLLAGLALMPFVYYRQLAELDAQLAENGQEILEKLGEAKESPLRPPRSKFIPAALRLRYVELEGQDPKGRALFRSINLGNTDLNGQPGEARSMEIAGRKARVRTMCEGPWTLHIGTRLGALEKTQREIRMAGLVIIPASALAVFLGGLWLGRRAVRPVADLTAAAERIGADRPAERLPVPPTGDEIARLTVVLNQSFDRLQRAYDAAARFSADASHQLKTPVSVLRAGLESMRGSATLPPPEKEEINALLRQTRRLSALIDDLLLLAQADANRLELEPRDVDLLPLLEAAWDDLETSASARDLTLERNLPKELHALADPRRVSLILQNLVENALKYTPPKGRVRLVAERMDGAVTIRLTNSGAVIPEEERERLFERFHRGREGENVQGHGLGLNIARELARAHGGELWLSQADAEWTEFTLSLPRPMKRE